MNKVSAILLSSLSAFSVPTLGLIAIAAAVSHAPDTSSYLTFMAFLIAACGALHVLFIGIPAFLLLRWLNFVSWWSMSIVGFFAGCLPIGLVIALSTFDSSQPYADLWDDPTVVARYGVPTAAGWHFLFQRAGTIGLLGAVGGFAFWYTWAHTKHSN